MGIVEQMSEQDMLDHLVYLGILERKVSKCVYPVAGVSHERTTVRYESAREVIRDTERGIL
jgi:hypothetical protein